MTLPQYVCTDLRRRQAIAASPLNGIDFVEIIDADTLQPADRQRLLRVAFLKSPPPAGLVPANFVISGGERITSIAVDTVTADANTLLLHLSAFGDFSTYQLAIQGAAGSSFDPASLDPLLSVARFSFKVDCPTEFDCQAEPIVVTPLPQAPLLDYLSRDYTSFRQLMLDRVTTLSPGWTERNAADLGVTLVELLAHVGDLLSYRQDAIATEAYLGTARRRVSVRRHARLVDYFVQDGANARTFLHLRVNVDITLPKGVQAFTTLPGEAPRLDPASPDLARARALGPQIFETMHDASLFADHNEILFYTWGDTSCRLPQGSTSATLKGHFPALRAGDILVFEEVVGPRTGQPGDADPLRRCAVRLTSVAPGADPIGGAFEVPPTAAPTPVTEVEWTRDDATPMAFQISDDVLSGGAARHLDRISVARGNIVLADHGATIVTDAVGQVPAPNLFRPAATAQGFALGDPTPIPVRFRPQLKAGPLVHAVPYDPLNPPASACATLATNAADAVPFISLSSTVDGQPPMPWTVERDLLESDAETTAFVVETESDGSASLRFGDDTYGQRPAPGTVFTAQYRIGDPTAGNVAADAISHVVTADPAVVRVRNPLPATGGVAPESIEHVRATAPFAFRSQQRAVTPADYQAVAERHPNVQRASASFRWTGSWHTIFVTVDRFGGLPVDDAFVQEMLGVLEPYRMAGHDLQVGGPKYVPLDIAMVVTAQADHFRPDVKEALLQVFGTGVMPDGRPQVFNPDNFTFGQPTYLSSIYAAAQAVDGVAAVVVTRFERRDRPGGSGLNTGRLDIAALEIARLDNDPDFPERGTFQVTMRGGK